MAPLTIHSSVAVPGSAVPIPLLGFGVFQSTAAYDSTTAALNAGYRHIDSARYYHNEAEVCKAVSEWQKTNAGEKVWLTTKVQGAEHGTKLATAAVAESIATAAKYGLKWDLFLLHDPTAGPEKRLEAWRVLEAQKKAGAIGSIGVSNFGVRHLQEFKAAGLEEPIGINQVEIHPFCQQKEIVEYSIKEGIVVEAYCPLIRAQAGKFDHPTLVGVAEKVGKSVAQVLVRWSLQRGFVPLPKSDTPSRIVSNAELYDFELDSAAMKALDDLDLGKDGAISWNPVDRP